MSVIRMSASKVLALFVVLLQLAGMILTEPAEARRGARGIGGRSVMRGAGRMSRGITRGLLGGRRGRGRGRGGRRYRSHQTNQAHANDPALNPNGYPAGTDINNVNPNRTFPSPGHQFGNP